MADEWEAIDVNSRGSLTAVSTADDKTIVRLVADPDTGALVVTGGGGGSGTVTSITAGTGLTASPTNPITTTGTIALDSKLAPLDTLGSAGQLIRVNAGATALEYFTAAAGGVTSVVGTANRITVDSTTPSAPIVDIAATYVGQTSITTLGTIATGTWSATTIALNKGGTGQTTKAAAFDALSPMTTGGDIIYGGASGTGTRLANGSAGQVLTSAGTTLAPTWSTMTAAGLTVGTSTITSGTTTRILYDNAGVLGEYTITGTGTVVAMQTNPTLSGITMTDATNIVLNATTGTKIGTATTQKLGFFNATPIVQPTGDIVTALGNLGLVGTPTVAATSIVVGTTTVTGGTSTRILYDNAGVLGEYTLTGTGTIVMMQTAPTFVTSMTGPLLIGGSGTTGTQLTLKTTTGNGTTDALVILGGNNGGTTFATFSANVLNLGTSATLTTGTIELGAATDTTISRSGAGVIAVEGVVIPSISSTNTLTNKRITRRSATTNAPGGTPTTNSDNVDLQIFTGLNAAITSMTTNLSGTPVRGDFLEFNLTDDGTARAITWGASFVASTVALPTTTVISTLLAVLFEWNGSAWRCVAVA